MAQMGGFVGVFLIFSWPEACRLLSGDRGDRSL
jgi:hypothetical protein